MLSCFTLSGAALRPGGSVLIVTAAQPGLAVATLAMLEPGDVIAVDAPDLSSIKGGRRSAPTGLVPANPAAAEGLIWTAPISCGVTLRIARDPPCRYAAQSTGVGLPPSDNDWAIIFAREHGLLIIEDAAYFHTRMDHRRNRAPFSRFAATRATV